MVPLTVWNTPSHQDRNHSSSCESEADRYLLKAVRTTPFFVSIAKVPFFLALPLCIRCCLNHVALEVDVYKNSFSFRVQISHFYRKCEKYIHFLKELSLSQSNMSSKKQRPHTCKGTVALLVWRCARVRRSTRILIPFESIRSFTFLC